jgi:hypothetical protein
MSITNFLDDSYSGLSSCTASLRFFPAIAAFNLFSGCGARQYARQGQMNNPDPSLAGAFQFIGAEVVGPIFALGTMLILAPIVLPLTIATFALALAIDIAALLTKLVTYPLALGFDSLSC